MHEVKKQEQIRPLPLDPKGEMLLPSGPIDHEYTFHAGLTQEGLSNLFRVAEICEFPGAFDLRYQQAHRGSRNYVFFSPSHHTRPAFPVITVETISDLQEHRGPLLSVGAGPAYTERLLVNRFGVDPSNIYLADNSSSDIPQGFPFVQFDMHKPWPELPVRFRHIVLLESSLISLSVSPDKFDGPDRNFHFEQALYFLLNEGIKNLLPGGQIRLTVSMSDDAIRDALCRLEQQWPALTYVHIPATMCDSFISVKRGEK